MADIRRGLRGTGLTIGNSLGFNNTYALAVRREMSERLGVRAISDLERHPELEAAFSSGFTDREDGWPGLRRHYGLELADVRVMEHALTYEALAAGEVDVIDIYSTDGKLERLDLTILEDDRRFFPDYQAVLLAREDFIERFPLTWQALVTELEGQIDEGRMSHLNALADLDGKSFPEIVAEFFGRQETDVRGENRLVADILKLTGDHLYLVFLSLGVAVLLGVPLGIVAARHQELGQVELMAVGVLQTIPSLALLCFMIPLFGIGKLPGPGGLVPLRPSSHREEHLHRPHQHRPAAPRDRRGPWAFDGGSGSPGSSCPWPRFTSCRESRPPPSGPWAPPPSPPSSGAEATGT